MPDLSAALPQPTQAWVKLPLCSCARKRGNPAPAWPGPCQGACQSTGNSRQSPADRGIMMNEITATATPGRNRGRLSRRALRTVLSLSTAACALALAVGGASAADAQVNPSAPEYTFPWGDCPVTLGSVAWPKGWAVGGVDVNCHSRHSYVSATVYLWRWNNTSGWTEVGSGSGAFSNAYGISAWTTPPFCGGGNTYWDETATVRVDNSSKTFDLYQGLGRYPQYPPGSC